MAKCQDRIACRHVVFSLLFSFLSLSSLVGGGHGWWRVGGRSRKKEREGEGREKSATTATVTTVVAVFAKLLGSPAYA